MAFFVPDCQGNCLAVWSIINKNELDEVKMDTSKLKAFAVLASTWKNCSSWQAGYKIRSLDILANNDLLTQLFALNGQVR